MSDNPVARFERGVPKRGYSSASRLHPLVQGSQQVACPCWASVEFDFYLFKPSGWLPLEYRASGTALRSTYSDSNRHDHWIGSELVDMQSGAWPVPWLSREFKNPFA